MDQIKVIEGLKTLNVFMLPHVGDTLKEIGLAKFNDGVVEIVLLDASDLIKSYIKGPKKTIKIKKYIKVSNN